jgi:glycosyltransferase involved in cell wall biosynthesis
MMTQPTNLSVLSIAFPFAPVGPAAVGGAEQILTWLDRALVSAGHTSLVIACQGSQPSGELISISLPEEPALGEAAKASARIRIQSAIDRALSSRRIDLVHIHGFDFNQYRFPPEIPVLVTLHLPIGWYAPEVWQLWRHRARFCCVSQSQRRTCPPEIDAIVIENGVPLPPSSGSGAKQDFALVLARICPEKNADAALAAGTRAGIRVLLAGQVFPWPEHQRYFREKIEPLLEPSCNPLGHRYLGPVDAHERPKLIASARCLLHPTLAPETSSLVAMEALAAGTPVVAYPSGALPEIVENGVTGYLVDTMEEMARAIAHVQTLSPQACRAAAEQRFSLDRMIRSYFELYYSMARPPHPDPRPEPLHA